ncbi:MAG TPA: response regulator transcription factor [Vicinamibacterales bacterium]|jgi:two-component system response regulator NreC|nr:response regulator transcription factor [Vicinamibacterales bacterium]
MALRILIADDHAVVRQGFRALLEREGFEVVGEAVNGQDAVRLAAELKPDIALLDVSMPLLNGLEAGREIQRAHKDTQVVLLTMRAEDHLMAAALRGGIRAYVLKSQAAEDLVLAIRAVARHQIYLSPGLSRFVVDAYLNGESAPVDPLAPRERQVLQLVAEGKTSKEIAVVLGLSTKTADSYRARVMEKLDIHEIAGLVRYAIRQGIVEA